MTEKAKRLAPAGDTLRRLFLTSGNLCAYPGCSNLMMDQDGVFIGQVCHIEAAEEGGERFNSNSTNEERRSFDNLMLMCYPHHKVSDDVVKYPVEKLKQIKADHEKRFADPQRAMLQKLTDWTELDAPTLASNLRRLDKALKWDFSEEELEVASKELNSYVGRLRHVPIELRRFLGAVVLRARKMRMSNVVQHVSGTSIVATDIERALGLSRAALSEKLSALEGYSLMSLDQIETSFRPEPALRIDTLRSGWDLWSDLAEFCEVESLALEVFTEDLDFARLDA